MPTILHNRLVRDGEPQVIAHKGWVPHWVNLSDTEFLSAMIEELREEVGELAQAKSPREVGEKTVDILEVLDTYVHRRTGLSLNQLKGDMLEKRRGNGGFNNKIFLISVTE